jgi:hypothetical protein
MIIEVKTIIPHQRANTRDPSIETPPFRAGRGHPGIDLQIFSSSGSREKLLEIVDEVIDAGFREAERYIEKGWRRDRRSFEGEEGGDSVSPLS